MSSKRTIVWKEMLFQANSFLQVMKPWYNISRCIGLCPYKLDESKKCLKTKLIGPILWCIVTLVPILVLFIYACPEVENKNFNSVVIVMDYIVSHVESILIVIIELIMANATNLTYTNIMEIDQDFARMGVHLDYSKHKRNVLIEILVAVAFIAYSLLIFGIFLRTDIITNLFFFYTWAQLIQRTFIVLEIYIFTENLLYRFCELNNRMDALCPKNFTLKQRSNDSARGTARWNISGLRRLHIKLCETSTSINERSSLQVVIIIAQAFLIIVVNLYYGYASLLEITNNRHDYSVTRLICSIFVCVEFATFTITLIVIFAKVKIEGEKTGSIIFRVIGEIKDVDSRKELLLFSSQIGHMKVTFSGCGLFPLDASLLCTMAGAITTYMIIFIQFQNYNFS